MAADDHALAPAAGAPALLLLLGPVEFRLAERTVLFGPERRCQLLACLAVQPGTWVERDRLAALLWPGHDLVDARHNLRKVIFTARDLSGTVGFEATTQALRWSVGTDLAQLQQGHGDLLAAADAGWRGQPLAGLDDSGNPAWTEWLADERTRALALWQQAAQRHLQGLEDLAARQALAQQLLRADPCDELAAQVLVAALAARGRPGEAQRVYSEFVIRLRDELGVEPSHALRDVAALAALAGEATAPSAAPSQAPTRQGPGAFVGRRLETRQIVQWLGAERCPALVLVGLGGCGKSRLARQALPALSPHFQGAVHWVELDDLHDLAAVVARIATLLGVVLNDRSDAVESLLQGMPTSPLLLVLDNAEHLPELPALVQRLLASRAALQVLLTSREQLHMPSARALLLAGLDVPDADSRDAEAAASFDAVALFQQCASAARPGFEAAQHMDAVVGIVDLLGGMPLAIQLAAAWVRLLPPAAILQQLHGLHESIDVLEADPATAAPLARPAHASLRRVLEQACQRLAAREAEALTDLAVFVGGFMPDAARAVAHVSLPVLACLTDRSLVSVSDTGRFAMHPLVAAYAAERLALAPEHEALLRERHANFYCRQLLALAPHARARQRVLIDGVNAEFANARAAWAHALADGRAELVASAVNVWRIYYEVQGRLVEGRAALRPALQLHSRGVSAVRASAAVRHSLAMLAMRLGELDEARALAESAIHDGEQLEDAHTQTGGWLILGSCAQLAGRQDEARQASQRALDLARASGDRHAQATALGNLGIAEKRLGHGDAALALYHEALAMERELDNSLQVAMHLNNIAALHSSSGRWNDALQTIHEARQHCQRHGVVLLLPFLALNQGMVALEQGQFAESRAPFDEALALARTAHNRQVELAAQIGLARADLNAGEPARALRTLAEVATSARAHGLLALLPAVVGCTGEALVRQGRQAAAARCLAAAVAQPSADVRDRGRWSAALRSLPGEVPATAPRAFEECLDQIVAGRMG